MDRPLRPGVSMEGVGSVWPAFLDTGGGRLWRAGSPAGEPPVLTVTWGVGPLTGGSAPLLSQAVAVEHTARARSRCNASSAPSSEPQWPRLRAPRRRLRWPPRPPGRFPAWVCYPLDWLGMFLQHLPCDPDPGVILLLVRRNRPFPASSQRPLPCSTCRVLCPRPALSLRATPPGHKRSFPLVLLSRRLCSRFCPHLGRCWPSRCQEMRAERRGL